MKKPVPIPVNNPLYPLPEDYRDLSTEGRRQARVNACRQWMIDTEDRDLKAHRFVESTRFFDRWYLHPDETSDFDPMFYDQVPLPTPEIHWAMSRKWATNRQNADVMPRGAAKSTHLRRTALMRMITHPNYSQVYATSTHENAKVEGQRVRAQVYENERLAHDWEPEYGVLAPSKGKAPSGVEYFFCTNGSSYRVVSAQTRLRGQRPRRFLLDDPEYDPTASTSMAIIREYMDRLLFKIVLPMVMRPDCGVDWVGTFVSKRHFLYHVMDVTENDRGELISKDPRFAFFNRDVTKAVVPLPDGDYKSCWPAMWPKDKREKRRLKLHRDTLTLEDVRARVGEAVWQSEFLANPGSGDIYFKLDTDPHGKHAWWLENVDNEFISGDPWRSTTTICWKRDGQVIKERMGAFLRNTKQFITADTSWTNNTHSDRKVVNYMAVTDHNELFDLDLWSAQCDESVCVDKAFRVADRWKCPGIWPEVVKQSFGFYQRLLSVARTKATEEMGLSHCPHIKELRVGQTSKESKIGALDLRFEHGLIKLPLFRKGQGGPWDRLFEQIQGFNPEADDGGLQHDDEIDSVAMSMFVLKGRLRKFADGKEADEAPDALKELRKGNTTINGMPAIAAVNLNRIDRDTLSEIMSAIQEKGKPKSNESLA